MATEEINIKNRLIPVMNRTAKTVALLLDKRLNKSDLKLTLKQFILLVHASEQTLPQCELALITDRDKGSLTRLIQSMEKKELIRRHLHSTDKRMNMVSLSQKGERTLTMAKPIVLNTFKQVTHGLTNEQQDAFIAGAKTIMNNANTLFENEQ